MNRVDRALPNKRFEADGARRLGNESFVSAPQLKRDPLGCATRVNYEAVFQNHSGRRLLVTTRIRRASSLPAQRNGNEGLVRAGRGSRW